MAATAIGIIEAQVGGNGGVSSSSAAAFGLNGNGNNLLQLQLQRAAAARKCSRPKKKMCCMQQLGGLNSFACLKCRKYFLFICNVFLIVIFEKYIVCLKSAL